MAERHAPPVLPQEERDWVRPRHPQHPQVREESVAEPVQERELQRVPEMELYLAPRELVQGFAPHWRPG